MSIAMLSAISLICVDVAMMVRAPDPAAVAPLAVLAAQGAAAGAAPDAPPTASANPAETQHSAGEVVSDEEDYLQPLVFEGESDDQVVDRLINYIEGIKTLQGDFTQITPSGAISAGRFYLRRPGFLRFEYDPPSPLLVVANGGMVYVRDEALETTDSYPVGKTPLKFLLRRKVSIDDAAVRAVDRGVDSIAVTFASDEGEAEGELTIIVTAPEMTLARWIVRDIQNGMTVVTLDKVKSGERLANRLFETPDAGGTFLKN